MPPLIAAAITAALPALGATAVTIGATAVTYATIAANVIFTAALVGAQYALAMSMQKKPPSQRVTRSLKQADYPRFYVGGRWRTSGVYHFEEAYVGSWYGFGLIYCCGPIDAVEIFEESDRVIDITDTNGPGAPTLIETETHKFPVTLRIAGRFAMFAEISLGYPEGYHSDWLQTYFPTLWTTDHKAKGLCCFYGVDLKPSPAESQYAYPNVFPQMNFTVRGARIYDPREPGHAAEDDWNDPATWEWSDNGPLLLAWYLRHPGSPIKADVDDINWETFAEVADKVDTIVPGYGGSFEKFARTNLLWDESEAAQDVFGRILASFDGILEEDAQGRWSVRVREWSAPRVTLGDADFSAMRIEPASSRLNALNRLEVTFTDPAKRYEASPSFRIEDTESQSRIGVKSEGLHFHCVPSKTQAYRMGVRYMRRLNGKRRIQATTGPRGLLCIGENIVAIDSPAFGVTGFFVVESNEGTLHARQITLLEVAESDFDDIVIPEDPAESIPTLVTTPPTAPSSITLTWREDGGIAHLRASVAASADDNVDEVEFEWALADVDADYVPFVTPIGMWSSESEGLAGGVTYHVRARYRISGGLPSAWTHDTIAVDSLAPPAPVSLTATGGVGICSLWGVAPNSTRFHGMKFWRAATGAGFGSATAISPLQLGAPNATLPWTDTVAAGTYDYFVTAESAAAEASPETGPETATVT